MPHMGVPHLCSSMPAQAGQPGAPGHGQPARKPPPLLAFQFAALKQAWASFLSSHRLLPEDGTNENTAGEAMPLQRSL